MKEHLLTIPLLGLATCLYYSGRHRAARRMTIGLSMLFMSFFAQPTLAQNAHMGDGFGRRP